MDKKNAVIQLRAYLAQLFDARFQGIDNAAYAKTKGFADGYMQAMSDLALVDDRELLSVVNDERRTASKRADIGLASVPSGQAIADFA